MKKQRQSKRTAHKTKGTVVQCVEIVLNAYNISQLHYNAPKNEKYIVRSFYVHFTLISTCKWSDKCQFCFNTSTTHTKNYRKNYHKNTSQTLILDAAPLHSSGMQNAHLRAAQKGSLWKLESHGSVKYVRRHTKCHRTHENKHLADICPLFLCPYIKVHPIQVHTSA